MSEQSAEPNMDERDIERAKETVDAMLRHRKGAMLITDCVAISTILKELKRREQVNTELLEALQGVVRVADRKTVEFDAARAAISKATTAPTICESCGRPDSATKHKYCG